jgi:hypothetical protein
MSPLRRNSLIAALVAALLLGTVHFSLNGVLVPSMLEQGNHSLLNATATALTNFYADFQRWPRGSLRDIWAELTGRPPLDASPDDPTQSKPPTIAEAVPLVNYFRELPIRAGAEAVIDAWGVPFKFEFSETGPARIISAGPDRQFGTGDDMTAEASPAPRNTRPTRTEFRRSQEIRRQHLLEQAKRKNG